jgi:hypothetical protein
MYQSWVREIDRTKATLIDHVFKLTECAVFACRFLYTLTSAQILVHAFIQYGPSVVQKSPLLLVYNVMPGVQNFSNVDNPATPSSSLGLEDQRHTAVGCRSPIAFGRLSASRNVSTSDATRLYTVALFCSTTALLFADQSLLSPNVRKFCPWACHRSQLRFDKLYFYS